MNQQRLFQVDAFAEEIFSGNPAAVCPLAKWLSDDLMQKIALENNLSETAFFIRNFETGEFHIRWFTPVTEVDLCGHATLAAAHVIFKYLGYPEDHISFQSHSGILSVEKKDGILFLDFPTDDLKKEDLPSIISDAFGKTILECYRGRSDYLLVFENEDDVRSLRPNFHLLKGIAARGFIVSAKGNDCDFVSRFFGPGVGVNEDPVTGSAHTTLIPYWSKKLGKDKLYAKQLSARGGKLFCENLGNRVKIGGQAKTYLIGTIEID